MSFSIQKKCQNTINQPSTSRSKSTIDEVMEEVIAASTANSDESDDNSDYVYIVPIVKKKRKTLPEGCKKIILSIYDALTEENNPNPIKRTSALVGRPYYTIKKIVYLRHVTQHFKEVLVPALYYNYAKNIIPTIDLVLQTLVQHDIEVPCKTMCLGYLIEEMGFKYKKTSEDIQIGEMNTE